MSTLPDVTSGASTRPDERSPRDLIDGRLFLLFTIVAGVMILALLASTFHFWHKARRLESLRIQEITFAQNPLGGPITVVPTAKMRFFSGPFARTEEKSFILDTDHLSLSGNSVSSADAWHEAGAALVTVVDVSEMEPERQPNYANDTMLPARQIAWSFIRQMRKQCGYFTSGKVTSQMDASSAFGYLEHSAGVVVIAVSPLVRTPQRYAVEILYYSSSCPARGGLVEQSSETPSIASPKFFQPQ